MNNDGNTPLHYFCQKFKDPECHELIESMLKAAADINAQNQIGEAPLHKAVFNNAIRYPLVRLNKN